MRLFSVLKVHVGLATGYFIEEAPHLLLQRNLKKSAYNLGAKLQVHNSSSPLTEKIPYS